MSGFFVLSYKNEFSVERSSVKDYQIGKDAKRIGCNKNIGKNKKVFVIVSDNGKLQVGYVGVAGEKVTGEQPWLQEGGREWRNVHKVDMHTELIDLSNLCEHLGVDRKIFTTSIMFGHVRADFKADFEKVEKHFLEKPAEVEEVKVEEVKVEEVKVEEVKVEQKIKCTPFVIGRNQAVRFERKVVVLESQRLCPACKLEHECHERPSSEGKFSSYSFCYRAIIQVVKGITDSVVAKRTKIEHEAYIKVHSDESRKTRIRQDMPIIKKPYLWYNTARDSDHWSRRDD